MWSNIIVYDQDPVFFEYICNQLGVMMDKETTRTVSYVRKNDDGSMMMLAVAAFNNWKERDVEISIVGRPGMWGSLKYIQAVYEYVFTHAKKQRATMVVEMGNARAIELHKRLGHKYVGILRQWYADDKDAMLFELTKEDYLKSKWSPKNKEISNE